jgi:hypothetical protein
MARCAIIIPERNAWICLWERLSSRDFKAMDRSLLESRSHKKITPNKM